MSYPISLELQPKTTQSIKQLQCMIMTRQMQQAIHLLQMPVMELAPAIEMELEQNPVLEQLEENEEQESQIQQLEEEAQEESEQLEEVPNKELNFDEKDFEILKRLDDEFHEAEPMSFNYKASSDHDKQSNVLENTVAAQKSLYQSLCEQASEVLENENERKLAEAVIGSLDDKGFLATPLAELAVLQGCKVEQLEKILTVIQTFQPPGVGARDLRESLLIQLSALGKKNTLAHQIVEKHFDDLLHNRIPKIVHSLHCTPEQVGEMIDVHIAKLDFHPGIKLEQQPISYIVPDVTLREEGDDLKVDVNEDSIPKLRLNRKYMKMMEDETLNQETKEFIRHKIVSAKWLLRNILQRNDTLEKIANALAKHQSAYFSHPEGQLVPLTMRAIAEELQLHESTIARAVANKYIETPRGLLPLRFFFTSALSTPVGEVSSNTVKSLLMEIISKEDKNKPFSDEAIASQVQKQGIQCARRTVAKYRGLLGIGSAHQRRKF